MGDFWLFPAIKIFRSLQDFQSVAKDTTQKLDMMADAGRSSTNANVESNPVPALTQISENAIPTALTGYLYFDGKSLTFPALRHGRSKAMCLLFSPSQMGTPSNLTT